MFPPLEPFAEDTIDVGNGHTVYYCQSGNPEGRPALILHGGPGAGSSPYHRRFFDPSLYRIIQFDQRGCGRSRPNAGLDANDTWSLVADMERLRHRLGIDRWLLFGGSWGSTLALSYAGKHREHCVALILRGVWLNREEDIAWDYDGLRRFWPEAFAEFEGFVPEEERGDLLAAYHRRLCDDDPAVHMPAAVSFCRWEAACERLLPSHEEISAGPETLALARIEAHFTINRAFTEPEALVAAAERLGDLPGSIVHGRYDMLCPVDGALAIARAWPGARLTLVPDAGHSAFEPGIQTALLAETAAHASSSHWEHAHRPQSLPPGEPAPR